MTVTYKVKVTDDTPVDCTKVTVAYVLGHETHGHPQSSTAGCTGSITTCRWTPATPAPRT